MDWYLVCSECATERGAEGLPTVCACGRPWLVRYRGRVIGRTPGEGLRNRRDMWRFAPFLPVEKGEDPISLGEGGTPLLAVRRLGAHLGAPDLYLKDEATNPTGSFTARGVTAAVTRAAAAGAPGFTLPTAGNAGVAASAYGARAGIPVRVFAPRDTPATILFQIRAFGAELTLLDGHIGDCGKASRAWAAESGAFDLSTLREPYRIEGKKTMGLELAEQLGWSLPDAILYPTGGGTGLIGMWKAFQELRDAGWIEGQLPRMYTVQSQGCAPVVKAFEEGRKGCEPWPDPETVASGLRVPGPLGDRLMLRALRESEGGAVAVPDPELVSAAETATRLEGIDVCPEGGAAIAGARRLLERGVLSAREKIVLFNTGAGWLYREPSQLLRP